jgi:hypothetical protein
MLRILSLVLAVCGGASAQLPEFYKTVDRIIWVVPDADAAVAGWGKMGFTDSKSYGEFPIHVEHRGKRVEASIKWSVVRMGDVTADFVQPLDDAGAFAEFRSRHKAGVMALLHPTPTSEALDAEVERMAKLGVGVLQKSGLGGGQDPDSRYVLFDTEADGKYVLGLIYLSPQAATDGPMATPNTGIATRKITQYAFVVKDFDPVSKYWAKLGFPALEITHPKLWDLRYKGEPGQFDAKLGWQRHGKVVYEWILPLKGPTVYTDHLDVHGEGFHHLAFNVEDMDKAIAEFAGLGFPFSQGGAWGEKGKPGYGRFAYHDTHAIGGTDIELLWNLKAE